MEYTEFIKPELMVLIPVLYLLGMALKSSQIIKDNFIPILLGVFGVILAVLYLLGQGYEENIGSLMFTGFVQGILAAGGSVYANQTIKQLVKEE